MDSNNSLLLFMLTKDAIAEGWTSLQPIRTYGSVHFTFEVHSQTGIPKSELYRDKILELHRLGMKKQAIADRLGLTSRVVRYAIKKLLDRGKESKEVNENTANLK